MPVGVMAMFFPPMPVALRVVFFPSTIDQAAQKIASQPPRSKGRGL
jgi:hypothetical protein